MTYMRYDGKTNHKQFAILHLMKTCCVNFIPLPCIITYLMEKVRSSGSFVSCTEFNKLCQYTQLSTHPYMLYAMRKGLRVFIRCP